MFIETTKHKLLEARCPQLHRAIVGKRYLLPQYRIGDYESQDVLNQPMYDWFVAALTGQINFSNDLMRMLLVNYQLALCYNRPTLYCERELAEALQRTDLPSDLSTRDIQFKWPQLRIILPSGTISREGHSLTHLDLCLVGAKQTIHWPEPIRIELQSSTIPLVENQLTGTGFNLLGAMSEGPTYTYALSDRRLTDRGPRQKNQPKLRQDPAIVIAQRILPPAIGAGSCTDPDAGNASCAGSPFIFRAIDKSPRRRRAPMKRKPPNHYPPNHQQASLTHEPND